MNPDGYDDNPQHDNSFEDSLDFNAWQLKPQYPKPYSDIIGKDAPLSNINNQRDMEHIDTNLRLATYLNGMKAKFYVGNAVFLEGVDEPVIVDETDIKKILIGFNGYNVVRITKLYDEKLIFLKSVHNKLSKAYTRMSLSRGINGQAAKDLKTIRHEESKSLLDLTNRNNWNPFKKKQATQWGNYEMQK